MGGGVRCGAHLERLGVLFVPFPSGPSHRVVTDEHLSPRQHTAVSEESFGTARGAMYWDAMGLRELARTHLCIRQCRLRWWQCLWEHRRRRPSIVAHDTRALDRKGACDSMLVLVRPFSPQPVQVLAIMSTSRALPDSCAPAHACALLHTHAPLHTFLHTFLHAPLLARLHARRRVCTRCPSRDVRPPSPAGPRRGCRGFPRRGQEHVGCASGTRTYTHAHIHTRTHTHTHTYTHTRARARARTRDAFAMLRPPRLQFLDVSHVFCYAYSR